jgi:hypothetical protein
MKRVSIKNVSTYWGIEAVHSLTVFKLNFKAELSTVLFGL